MAKGQDIKRRIKSITSMLQVTKAMEMISSIKMRRSMESAMRSKNYVFESWRSIIALTMLPENKDNPLLNERAEGRILVMVVSSDRGLAGSYNSDVLKKCLVIIEEYGLENIDFISFGKKARDFLHRIGATIVADFPLGQQIRFTMISPAALIAWEGFNDLKYRKFISIHTHFESVVRKAATTLQILPIDPVKMAQEGEPVKDANEYLFEPNENDVVNTVLRQIVRALTYQVILESEAAEHSARMIAMKNASDAAKDLKEDFQFTYNQLRQQAITQELAEISAGSNALN